VAQRRPLVEQKTDATQHKEGHNHISTHSTVSKALRLLHAPRERLTATESQLSRLELHITTSFPHHANGDSSARRRLFCCSTPRRLATRRASAFWSTNLQGAEHL
jgi:hypothetical protein